MNRTFRQGAAARSGIRGLRRQAGEIPRPAAWILGIVVLVACIAAGVFSGSGSGKFATIIAFLEHFLG